MKEIVIISGKGGTGKTSITAALAYLAKEESIIADCDVDAADMHLLLQPDQKIIEDFYSGKIAEINTEQCINCGYCQEKCRFNAVTDSNNQKKIDSLHCEGCGYCEKICPENAIRMRDNLCGQFYISNNRLGSTLVHAALRIGAENSGKLVSKVRLETKNKALNEKIPYIIIDGTPGIGCPVIASITGADLVIIVTEPTLSGLHDFKRALELTKKFNIPAACILNKFDLNQNISNEIEQYLKTENVGLMAKFPYHKIFNEAITNGKTIIEYDKENLFVDEFLTCWNKIKNFLNQKNKQI